MDVEKLYQIASGDASSSTQPKPKYLEPDDPYLKKNTKSVHGNPLIKMAFIWGTCAIAAIATLAFISSIMSPSKAKAVRNSAEPEVEQPVVNPISQGERDAKTAIADQQVAESIRQQKIKEEEARQKIEQEKKKRLNAARTVKTSRPPVPAPRNVIRIPKQAIAKSSPPKVVKPTPSPKPSSKGIPAVKRAIKRPVSPAPTPPAATKNIRIDPLAQLTALQNAGVYHGGAQSISIPTNSPNSTFPVPNFDQSPFIPSSPIPSGLQAQAKLITSVAWASGQDIEKPVTVELEEDFGPHAKGEKLNAIAKGDPSGLVEIIFEQMPNVSVSRKNDLPLIAKSRGGRRPNILGQIGSQVLNGVIETGIGALQDEINISDRSPSSLNLNLPRQNNTSDQIQLYLLKAGQTIKLSS